MRRGRPSYILGGQEEKVADGWEYLHSKQMMMGESTRLYKYFSVIIYLNATKPAVVFCYTLHSIPPRPTRCNMMLATTLLTIQPAPTKTAAGPYPHSSNIRSASMFCKATAQDTPCANGLVPSSYFQTTISMGNSFIHEETNNAVLIAFGFNRVAGGCCCCCFTWGV